jgi:thiosulfate/3-mercaptopyruvate sulfurtransferase
MKYLRGHLNGSVNLPVTRLLDGNGRLLPFEELAIIFGNAGVGDATAPVLYDSYDGQRGAFMAWVLEYLGHPDVRLMDTFFGGWTAQDREIFYRPVEPVARRFTARVASGARATLAEVENRGAARLLDVRTSGEFSGDADLDARPGHIPGATNIAWLQLLGDDHRFLMPAEDTQDVLASAGIQRGDSVSPIVASE